ncbi:nucleotidyltransferase domain-containing protein, partial [Candidatus Atribacteria bacterium HGW-Atribacteria-1]
MEKDISKIEDKLKSFLEEEKGILFGYLFGSMALGKTNLESDIDLAF